MPYASSSVRTCGGVSQASLEDASTDATSCSAVVRSMPSSSGKTPAGRRSHSARAAACPSARAADSGKSNVATPASTRDWGVPSAQTKAASTGLSSRGELASAEATASPTSSAPATTGGVKMTIRAS